MKKTIGLVFAAAFAAAIFFGCSNSSSDNSALLLAMGGNGGSSAPDRTGLPASEGTNFFAGKTFSGTEILGTAKYAFGSDTVTYTLKMTASTETDTVYSYSYNATTKQLFLKQVSSISYFINDGKRTAAGQLDSFTTDAGFIAAYKKIFKQLYPTETDEQLENRAKGMRYMIFGAYGYTDSQNATEVSNEIIAKYNTAQAEAKTRNTLVDIKAYDLSGSTLKLLSESRIPAGKSLNEIYGVYTTNYPISMQIVNILAIKDGSDNTVYNLNYASTPSVTPDIINAAGNEGYRVSSISANAINTSATATGAGSPVLWTFTPATGSFAYTSTITATSGVFDITGLGKITVTYATADNIPADWTSATSYTKE